MGRVDHRGRLPMKCLRWVTLALALAMPSAALADDDRTTKKEIDIDVEKKTAIDKDEPTAAGLDEAKRLHVKNHVVPGIAGVEAADKAIGAIYELSGTEN